MSLDIPAILYHGTSLERYEKIRTEGLLPSKVERMSAFTKAHHYEIHAKNSVYMTPNKKFAEFFASVAHDMFKPSVVLEISTENLKEDKMMINRFFQENRGELIYDDVIPPENIKVKSIIYPIVESWIMKVPNPFCMCIKPRRSKVNPLMSENVNL
jgi:RNA:NAD 2'-phosphotransferase (TPT1/KptA family)